MHEQYLEKNRIGIGWYSLKHEGENVAQMVLQTMISKKQTNYMSRPLSRFIIFRNAYTTLGIEIKRLF